MTKISRAYDAKMAIKQGAVAATVDMQNQRRTLINILQPQSGETILEVGCGNGDLAMDLLPHVGSHGTITGIDPSSAMIDQATLRIPEATFVEASATALPVQDGSQNAVVAAQVYCFVPDLTQAIAELFRALKPGGRLVILDTDWNSLTWNTGSDGDFAMAKHILLSHYAHPDIPARLPDLLSNHAFTDIRQSGFLIEDREAKPDSYAHGMNDYIETALSTVSKYSAADITRWQTSHRRLVAEGKFHFRVNRIITSATKAC